MAIGHVGNVEAELQAGVPDRDCPPGVEIERNQVRRAAQLSAGDGVVVAQDRAGLPGPRKPVQPRVEVVEEVARVGPRQFPTVPVNRVGQERRPRHAGGPLERPGQLEPVVEEIGTEDVQDVRPVGVECADLVLAVNEGRVGEVEQRGDVRVGLAVVVAVEALVVAAQARVAVVGGQLPVVRQALVEQDLERLEVALRLAKLRCRVATEVAERVRAEGPRRVARERQLGHVVVRHFVGVPIDPVVEVQHALRGGVVDVLEHPALRPVNATDLEREVRAQ